MVAKHDEERTYITTKEEIQQVELPSLPTDVPIINLNDQMEMKTMVDAIAAASQREAEARETAIMLSKENEDLRMKLKQSLYSIASTKQGGPSDSRYASP